MSVRTPKYRIHKGSGQALVQIDGRRIYLGKYGTEKSQERYRQLVAEWLRNGQLIDQPRTPRTDGHDAGLSVSELILAYWKFATSYYVKDGATTDEVYGIRAALRPLKKMYGSTLISEFGPRQLKNVRQSMIEAGRSRKYINDSVSRVRRMFRWAVENELYSAERLTALEAVQGLKRGRSAAKEPSPIMPVNPDDVARTLPYLSCVVRDMVQFQQLVGCRPGEVRILRPRDVDTSGDVWVYTPESHKTEHLGRQRRIFIGPRAQETLKPWLLRPSDAYCFSPIEATKEGFSKTGNGQPSVAFEASAVCASSCYTKDNYRQAITRACKKAGINKWTPNQLRHNCATEIRSRYGLEAAQAVLGHSNADVTQIYAERDFSLAARVMKEVG